MEPASDFSCSPNVSTIYNYAVLERYDDFEATETSGCNSSTSLTTVPPEVAVGTTVPNNVDIVGDSVILHSDISFKGVQTLF